MALILSRDIRDALPSDEILISVHERYGEVPEWLNGVLSKSTAPSRVPGVRIPSSPPSRTLYLPQPLMRSIQISLFKSKKSYILIIQ